MSLSPASTRYAVTRADLGLIIPCRCGEEGGAEDGAASANLPCGLEHDGDEATLSGEASNPPHHQQTRYQGIELLKTFRSHLA